MKKTGHDWSEATVAKATKTVNVYNVYSKVLVWSGIGVFPFFRDCEGFFLVMEKKKQALSETALGWLQLLIFRSH